MITSFNLIPVSCKPPKINNQFFDISQHVWCAQLIEGSPLTIILEPYSFPFNILIKKRSYVVINFYSISLITIPPNIIQNLSILFIECPYLEYGESLILDNDYHFIILLIIKKL